jgi:hypothetical protein
MQYYSVMEHVVNKKTKIKKNRGNMFTELYRQT